jgi:hypothetical protein
VRLLIGLAMILAATAASAQVDWQINGQRAPGDRSRASQSGFGAMMLITPDVEAFWRAWDGPSPPQVVTTDRADRGRPVTGLVILSGCAAGPNGNCNVTGVFTILRPDGTPYGEPLRGDLWKGPPAQGQNLQLGEGGAGLMVEPQDPMGIWTIRADVTDNVRNVTLQIEQRVTVDTPPTAPAA